MAKNKLHFCLVFFLPDMEYGTILTIQGCVKTWVMCKKNLVDTRNCVFEPYVPRAKMCKFVKIFGVKNIA